MKATLKLLALSSALMIPLMAFVFYVSTKYHPGQWPTWVTNTLLIWFTSNFFVMLLLSKRILNKERGQVSVDPDKVREATTKTIRIGTWLVVVWSALFLKFVTETLQGKFPLERAIPAGAFLLTFIGFFGWGIYRSIRKHGWGIYRGRFRGTSL